MHVIVLQQDMFFLCVTLMLKCQRCETMKQVQKGIFKLVDLFSALVQMQIYSSG